MASILNKVALFIGTNDTFDFHNIELKHLNRTTYQEQMKKETRKKLERFFKPRNERLYRMVGFKWD